MSPELDQAMDQLMTDVASASKAFSHLSNEQITSALSKDTVDLIEKVIANLLERRTELTTLRFYAQEAIASGLSDDAVINAVGKFLSARKSSRASEHMVATVMKHTRTPDHLVKKLFLKGLPE